MAVQETFTSAVASLLGSTTGIVAGIIAAAALWVGIDYLLSAVDINVPLRQFMFGRNLNALSLYGRYAYAAVGSFVIPKLRARQPQQACDSAGAILSFKRTAVCL